MGKISLILLIFCLPAWAVEVISIEEDTGLIAVRQPREGTLSKGENICVVSEHTTLCGEVISADSQVAHVHLDEKSAAAAHKDIVVSKKLKNEIVSAEASLKTLQRSIAATKLELKTIEAKANKASWEISAGTGFGFDYFLPNIFLQYLVSNHFTLGLRAPIVLNSSNGTSITGSGAALSGNYYSRDFMTGFWVQVGAGLVFLNIASPGVSETHMSYLVNGTVGWRMRLSHKVTLGFSGGMQYSTSFASTAVIPNFIGAKPLFTVDIGYNF